MVEGNGNGNGRITNERLLGRLEAGFKSMDRDVGDLKDGQASISHRLDAIGERPALGLDKPTVTWIEASYLKATQRLTMTHQWLFEIFKAPVTIVASVLAILLTLLVTGHILGH